MPVSGSLGFSLGLLACTLVGDCNAVRVHPFHRACCGTLCTLMVCLFEGAFCGLYCFVARSFISWFISASFHSTFTIMPFILLLLWLWCTNAASIITSTSSDDGGAIPINAAAAAAPFSEPIDLLGDLSPIDGIRVSQIQTSLPSSNNPSITCPSAAVERYCGRDVTMDDGLYNAVKQGGCVADGGQFHCPGGYVADPQTFFLANTTTCAAACSADGAALGVPDDYRWIVSEWAPCPVPCGGGLQTRRAACMAVKNGMIVPEWQCAANRMPTVQRSCGASACVAVDGAGATVQLGRWSECAEGGVSVRPALCVGGNLRVPVGGEACDAQLDRPAIQLGAVVCL